MKSTVLLSLFITSVLSAIPIPRGSTSAVISPNPSELRVYHQDNGLGSGIKEISVNTPPASVTNDDYVYNGQTRRNTPLAAITWKPAGASTPEIRVYFITATSTLGEVGYSGGRWGLSADLGFPVAADSNVLYGLKLGDMLVVGYVNGEGNLSEAYYNVANGGGWKSYVL